MKNLTNWLDANKISLNVKKTELVIFKQKNKLEFQIKIIDTNRKKCALLIISVQSFIEIEAWLLLTFCYIYTINFYTFFCHILKSTDV